MKIYEIENELNYIRNELLNKINIIGINKTVEITGLKYQDIQAWLKGRRRWSYEKILKVAEKMDISDYL